MYVLCLTGAKSDRDEGMLGLGNLGARLGRVHSIGSIFLKLRGLRVAEILF